MTTTTFDTFKQDWHSAWADERGFNAITIATMVAGFVVFWPVGLAVLARNIWKKKQYNRTHGMAGCGRATTRAWAGFSSGNSAFDAYRQQRMDELEAEMRRLNEEQRDFARFMDELKHAKDREEFDRYMASRKGPVTTV